MLRSLEKLCLSVKEPEEVDHEAKCHLVHEGQTSDLAALDTSSDWSCILGDDRLKKRVSNVMYLYASDVMVTC